MNPEAEEPKDTFGPEKYPTPEVAPEPIEDNLPGELPEKKFVHDNGFKKNPAFFWMWTGIFAATLMLLWGGFSWWGSTLNSYFSKSPFLQVTNRELSIFLWQFPQFLRQNVSSKTDYLTGFESDSKVGIKEGYAENWVAAPPEMLFFYHTWARLLKNEFTARKIPKSEFIEFLYALPEWQAKNWKNATSGYSKLTEDLSSITTNDLAELPLATLPQEVRMAFQGWKNFYKEGDEINLAAFTYEELERFLKQHPHYARNYWRNLVMDDYPDYLLTYTKNKFKPENVIPPTEIAPFLKVALFNWKQAQEGK